MRLAFITSSYPPHVSGVSTNAVTITQHLSDRGHQVGLFIPQYPSNPSGDTKSSPTLKLFHLPSRKNFFKKNHLVLSLGSSKLIQKLHDFNPDIIHLQEPNFLLFPAIKKYADVRKIPIVFAHHFPPEFIVHQLPKYLQSNLLSNWLMKNIVKLYNKSDHVITPTLTMKKLLINHGLNVDISVISNGVDTNKFTPLSTKLNSTKNKKETDQSHIILYLGRIDKDKNLDIILRAAKYIDFNYKIWFAGKGSATESLRSLVTSLQLDKQVRFLGFVPENKKVSIYRQATIFVMPSMAEAQSIVSLEAACCNIPLLLADASALPELLSCKYPNGILFDPNSPIDLANKINILLSSPKKLKSMGANSHYITEKHDIKKVIDEYEKKYLNLISSKV